jgi:hypothetical protein
MIGATSAETAQVEERCCLSQMFVLLIAAITILFA